MKRGHGINERYAENPVGSDDPRGKNRERRKHKLDGPTLTPTEQHIRNGLMRQFMRNPEGSTNADAYKSAPCWCECGRLKDGADKCERCLYREYCEQAPKDSLGLVSGSGWLKFLGQRLGLWDRGGRLTPGFDANGAPIE